MEKFWTPFFGLQFGICAWEVMNLAAFDICFHGIHLKLLLVCDVLLCLPSQKCNCCLLLSVLWYFTAQPTGARWRIKICHINPPNINCADGFVAACTTAELWLKTTENRHRWSITETSLCSLINMMIIALFNICLACLCKTWMFIVT